MIAREKLQFEKMMKVGDYAKAHNLKESIESKERQEYDKYTKVEELRLT